MFVQSINEDNQFKLDSRVKRRRNGQDKDEEAARRVQISSNLVSISCLFEPDVTVSVIRLSWVVRM